MACSFDIKVRNGIINKVSEEVDKSNLFDRNGTILTKKNEDSDVSLVIDNINNKYKDNVISPMTLSSEIRPEVEDLFETNGDFASKIYEALGFKILPKKQQATFMFSEFLDVYLQDFEQVEKILKEENIIEKDCTGGGKLKAEKGLQTNFTKGGEWKIYEIFEGKSHKQGGIDINIKNNQISFTNKNGSIKAKYGLVISKDN